MRLRVMAVAVTLCVAVTGALATRAQEPPATLPAPAASGADLETPLAATLGIAGQGSKGPEPAVLVVFNREVATMRTRVLGFGPDERVAAAMKRIDAQVAVDVLGPATAQPVSNGAFAVELAGKWMFYVTPGDVDVLAGEAPETAAREAAHRLDAALVALQEQRSLSRNLRAAGLTVGAFVLLLALLKLNRYLGRRGRAWLRSLTMQHNWHVDVLGMSLIDRRRLQKVGGLVNVAVQRSAVVILVYAWIVFTLNQFPYTRPLSAGIHHYLLAKLGALGVALLKAVPGLVVIAAVLLLTRWAVGATGSFFSLVESRRVELPWFHPDVAQPTRRLVAAFLWLLAVVVAYPFIPFSDSLAFKGVSVLFGVMISLGSSGVVSQAMSGLVLMYSRAVRVGEYVCIGDTEGTVTTLGILSTKIRTNKGEEVTIPNSVVVGTTTKNFSRLADEHGLLVYTSVTIGYDTPWRQVHAMLIAAAERTPGLLAEPRPFVLQTALSDFYVEYQLNARLEEPVSRARVLSALHASIVDRFNEHGVQIMSPHYEADPSAAKVVPPAQWFAAPAARFGKGEGDAP
ncbi:MAG: mechanosensitive ion channel family protein [Thermoanaerobaculaceae bacterium]|nr:mechanosensitive ion channel family protein [Thermoanaerobaculaceae bacterium]